jgi:flagella basal body P-ring formation protein FlgA
MRAALLLISSAALAHSACVAVSSARIVAGDLAASVPLFGSLDPAMQVSLAPWPGTKRILSAHELAGLLRRRGFESSPEMVLPDVCVQRVARPLSQADLAQALASALNLGGADIEIVDFGRQPLPPGHLEFQREGLNKPPRAAPDSPVIWRGKSIYDVQSSTPVWAKVRILVESQWLVAAENISAGAVIRPGQVHSITGRQFPDFAPPPPAPESIIGKLTRRNILRGERLAPGLINDPADIQKGDRVHVKVWDGLACLSLDAVAQSSGRKGDTILVHNPSNGRNFRAVVQLRGQVTVQPDREGID